MKMATPGQPSEPTPNRTNRAKDLFGTFRERVAKVSDQVAQATLSPRKRLTRFLLQTNRPLAERLLPPIGIVSILLLIWWTIGVPTGAAFGYVWPIVVVTACGIIFAYWLYRTPRYRQNAIFENTFGWLPVFLGALSYWYWYWYAKNQELEPPREFFLASAEVLPLLLVAAVVELRRTERLQSKQLLLPVVAVFLGILAALNALASDSSGPYSFAAVASSFVSSIVALVLTVMANIESSGSHVPALIEALKDPANNVRSAAARVLAWVKDPAAVPALKEALKDSDEEVRSEAAHALGMMKDPTAVPALKEALKDSSEKVRSMAAYALVTIMNPAAVSALIEALKDPNSEVRIAAELATRQRANNEPK